MPILDRGRIVVVDNTRLTAVASCQTRAYIDNVLGYKINNPLSKVPLEVGKAYHVAIEEYVKTQDRKEGLNAFQKYYEENVAQLFDRVLKQRTQYEISESQQRYFTRYEFERLRDIFDMWMDRHPIAEFPLILNEGVPEKRFLVPLYTPQVTKPTVEIPNIYLAGQFDMFGLNRDRAWEFIDIKTRSWFKPENIRREYRRDPQMFAYNYAARKIIEQERDYVRFQGMTIYVIGLPDKKVSNAICNTHGVVYRLCDTAHASFYELSDLRPTEEQLDAWRQEAVRQALRYQKLQITAQETPDFWEAEVQQNGLLQKSKYNYTCEECYLNYFCNNGRNLEEYKRDKIQETWFPYSQEELEDILL